MCTEYWTLRTPVVLPCGHTESEWQTHWHGPHDEAGELWMMEYRELGELVSPTLAEHSGRLSDDGEYFDGECSICGAFYEADGVMEAGRVVRLVILPAPA
jgi:hypothetical protein